MSRCVGILYAVYDCINGDPAFAASGVHAQVHQSAPKLHTSAGDQHANASAIRGAPWSELKVHPRGSSLRVDT
jgi:hypothetical protein